jgi:hypothetical protein
MVRAFRESTQGSGGPHSGKLYLARLNRSGLGKSPVRATMLTAAPPPDTW